MSRYKEHPHGSDFVIVNNDDLLPTFKNGDVIGNGSPGWKEYQDWLNDQNETIPNILEPQESQAEQNLRNERNQKIDCVIWYVDRHKQQTENTNYTIQSWSASGGESMDATEYQELLDYIQELRDMPREITDSANDTIQPYGTFENPIYPTKPSFMT